MSELGKLDENFYEHNNEDPDKDHDENHEKNPDQNLDEKPADEVVKRKRVHLAIQNFFQEMAKRKRVYKMEH